jgi:hypothetical protein
MTKLKFEAFINSNRESKRDTIDKLISADNPRQKTIYVNNEYYDGEHWRIDERGRSNTTKSGKLVWGKFTQGNISGVSNDAYGRDRDKSLDIAFHEGQLQVRNYIKQFIQVYQEYLFGESSEPFKITTKNDELDEALRKLWFDNSDVLDLSKDLIAKGVVTTVFTARLVYVDKLKDYKVESCDAADLFPIYESDETIGYINAFYIDGFTANQVFGIESSPDQKVTFAKVYYMKPDNNYYMTTIVDGLPMLEIEGKYVPSNFEDSSIKLVDELAFLPYYIQPNINHANRRFDDRTLEDSEIFGWIDKNDALNANETMAFLGTLLYVFPRTKIDFDAAEKLGIDPNSEIFKQGLSQAFPSMFEVNNLPIATEPGNPIDQSFYNQLDRIKSALFEESAIPEFLINGTGISQISERTMQLAMSALVKKIEQKRHGLAKLYENISKDYLKLRKLGNENINIVVEWGDVLPSTKEETANIFYGAVDRQILPARYVQRKILELINNEEDIEEVKEIQEDDLEEIRQTVDAQAAIQQAEDLARQQTQLDNEINALQ